jgi:hypothetical protein
MATVQRTLHLNETEARHLAWRMIGEMAAEPNDWLCWEDLPALDEDSFIAVSDAVKDIGRGLAKSARHFDSVDLFGQATE